MTNGQTDSKMNRGELASLSSPFLWALQAWCPEEELIPGAISHSLHPKLPVVLSLAPTFQVQWQTGTHMTYLGPCLASLREQHPQVPLCADAGPELRNAPVDAAFKAFQAQR